MQLPTCYERRALASDNALACSQAQLPVEPQSDTLSMS